MRAWTLTKPRRIARRVSMATEDPELRAIRPLLADPTIGPEIRALRDAGTRREARDRHAMSVLLAAKLPRDGNALDVGAHSGAVLREIVRVAPAGQHIAYEPIPELARQLSMEFPQVSVREAALSDGGGTATFVHVDSAPEFSGLRERTYSGQTNVQSHRITVRTERLDDALPDGWVPSLIKIDVEGAEMLVLRGGEQTIRRSRPTIVFEHGVGASEHYGFGPKDVYGFLVLDLDMRIFDLDGAGPYTQEMFEAVFPEPLWNFLAVP